MMSVQNETAYLDNLTGIYNRAFMFATQRYSKMDGAIMMDINSFKSINDNYAHEEGDEAFRIVAGFLKDDYRWFYKAARFCHA